MELVIIWDFYLSDFILFFDQVLLRFLAEVVADKHMQLYLTPTFDRVYYFSLEFKLERD